VPTLVARVAEQDEVGERVRLDMLRNTELSELCDVMHMERSTVLFGRQAAVNADAITLTNGPLRSGPGHAVVSGGRPAAPVGIPAPHPMRREGRSLAGTRAESTARRMTSLYGEHSAAGGARLIDASHWLAFVDSDGSSVHRMKRPSSLAERDTETSLRAESCVRTSRRWRAALLASWLGVQRSVISAEVYCCGASRAHVGAELAWPAREKLDLFFATGARPNDAGYALRSHRLHGTACSTQGVF